MYFPTLRICKGKKLTAPAGKGRDWCADEMITSLPGLHSFEIPQQKSGGLFFVFKSGETSSYLLDIPENHLLCIISLEGAVSFFSEETELHLSRYAAQVVWIKDHRLYFSLRKGHRHSLLFLCFPVSQWKTLSEINLQVHQLLTHKEQLSDAGLFVFPRVLPDTTIGALSSVLARICDEAEAGQEVYRLTMSCLRKELKEAGLTYLNDSFCTGIATDDKPFFKAVWLIMHNPVPRTSLAFLVEATETGEKNLRKSFQKHFGMSVLAFREHMRMEKAKSLLKEGNDIKDIAEKLEFSSTAQFSGIFSRKTGCSPDHYRREEKHDPFRVPMKIVK